jgi:hypothetical protein
MLPRTKREHNIAKDRMTRTLNQEKHYKIKNNGDNLPAT